jgi:hypothetical protein
MKSFLLVLTIIVGYTAIAQSPKTSVNANFKETPDRSTFLFSFNNKQNDKVCLLMISRELVTGFIMNDSGLVLNRFDFPKANKRILPIGGYFEDDKITMLFGRNASDETISKYYYSLSDSKIDSATVVTDFGKQSVISVINTGNNTLFVCADKKEPRIYLYQMINGKIEQSEQYDFSTLDNFPYEKNDFYVRLRKFPLYYIDESKQKSPVQLSSRNKLYYRNDSLIFTLDKKGQSELFFIDRKAKACAYKALQQNIDYCDNEKEVLNLNSYLLNNDLYYVKVCHEGLQLNVSNIITGNELAKFVCEADKPLSFKNSRFMRMIGAENKSDVDKESNIIWNQKTFLRRASANDFLVAAETDTSNDILLRIGSFDITTLEERQQAVVSIFPVVGILPSLVGLVAVDIIQPPDWSTTVYFQSKLQTGTYQHVPGNMQQMTEEKIATLIADKKIKPQHKLLLKYSAVNYFVYYDKETDALIFNKI